jgi:integrase
MKFLSPEEIDRLAEAIGPRYRALVYVAAYSGMRFGELANLKVDSVNVLSGAIRFEDRGLAHAGNIPDRLQGIEERPGRHDGLELQA